MKLTLTHFKIAKGFILTKGKWRDCNDQVTIVNAYTPCIYNETFVVSGELINRKRAYENKVCCVIGDFNAITNHQERNGTGQMVRGDREIEGFNSFIERTELSDILTIGRQITWYSASGNAMSRLDRVL